MNCLEIHTKLNQNQRDDNYKTKQRIYFRETVIVYSQDYKESESANNSENGQANPDGNHSCSLLVNSTLLSLSC